MLDTWIIHNFIRVPLGVSVFEEGWVVTDGEWSPQPRKKPTGGNTEPEQKKTLQAEPLEEKGW
jgi:hypothetical protein